MSEARAYGSLRTALFRLRAVCPGGSVLECRSECELSATVGVDVRRAYELAARLESAGTLNGDMKALELLLDGGDLLPDWYDDWVLIERERFHEVRLRALENVCESHLALSEVTSAIRCASAAVRADPLRETSRRVLICALLVEGNRAEALAHRHPPRPPPRSCQARHSRRSALDPDRDVRAGVHPPSSQDGQLPVPAGRPYSRDRARGASSPTRGGRRRTPLPGARRLLRTGERDAYSKGDLEMAVESEERLELVNELLKRVGQTVGDKTHVLSVFGEPV